MKREKKHDDFTDVLHGLLKVHTKNQALSFGDILTIVYGYTEPQQISDEQLLVLIENINAK